MFLMKLCKITNIIIKLIVYYHLYNLIKTLEHLNGSK